VSTQAPRRSWRSVKADAYGHGAPQVARAAVAAGAAELGVATIDEALALRRGGITGTVLSWLHPPGTDFAPALSAGVQDRGVLRCARSGTCSSGRTHRAHRRGHRQGGHRAQPQRGEPRRLSRRAHRAAARRRRRRDPDPRHHVAPGQRRRPDDPLNDLQAQRFTALIAEPAVAASSSRWRNLSTPRRR